MDRIDQQATDAPGSGEPLQANTATPRRTGDQRTAGDCCTWSRWSCRRINPSTASHGNL